MMRRDRVRTDLVTLHVTWEPGSQASVLPPAHYPSWRPCPLRIAHDTVMGATPLVKAVRTPASRRLGNGDTPRYHDIIVA